MTALRTPLYLFFAIVFCNILNIEAQNTNVEVNNYAENITKKLTKDFSKGEREAMFHDTAMRVYRLPRV